MDLKIRKCVHRGTAERRGETRRLGGVDRGRVATCAANRRKKSLSPNNRGGGGGVRRGDGNRRGKKSHEDGVHYYVARDGRACCKRVGDGRRPEICRVLRVTESAKVQAVRWQPGAQFLFGQWTVLREYLVGDALLHVVGFSGE